MNSLFRRSAFLAGGAGLLGLLSWGLWPSGDPAQLAPGQAAPFLAATASGAPDFLSSRVEQGFWADKSGPAQGGLAQGGQRSAMPDDIEIQKLDVAAWLAKGGDPLLNADLIRIFEQILGRAPEHPEQQLVGRIPPEFLAQAQRLLAQYRLYRESLSGLRPADYGTQPSQMLEGVLTARLHLQQQFFSAGEITGLFEEDNRYDAFSVSRLRISERDDLSLAQKEAMLAERSAALLSPAQQEARQTAGLPARILSQNAAMDQDGMMPDQRRALRTTLFGAEAAGRMAEVDRQESAWKQRIARLAQADAQTQQQMRKSDFTPAEQLRLDAALSLYRAELQRVQTR